eukprot:g2257.t1
MNESSSSSIRTLGEKLGKRHAARHMTSLMRHLRSGSLRQRSPGSRDRSSSKSPESPTSKNENSPYITFLMEYLSLKSADEAVRAAKRLRESVPPKRLGARKFLISELRSYLPTPTPSLSPSSSVSSVSSSSSLSSLDMPSPTEETTKTTMKIPTLRLPSNAKKDFQNTFSSIDKSLSWRLESLRHRRHRLLSLYPNLIREMFWTMLFLSRKECVYVENLPELVSSVTCVLKMKEPSEDSLKIPFRLLSKRPLLRSTKDDDDDDDVMYRGAYSVVTSNSFAVTKRFREDRVSLSRMCSEVEYFQKFSSFLFLDAYDLSLRSKLAECTLADYVRGEKNRVTTEMFCSVLRRVAELHESGVTHYDIRGDNIVLFEDTVYLIDFGDASSTCLSETDLRGTERVRDVNVPLVPFKSDVYSLGCLMYELYSGGSYLFDEGQVSKKVRRERIEDGARLLSDSFRRCFLMCMNDRASDRPSVRELLEELEE